MFINRLTANNRNYCFTYKMSKKLGVFDFDHTIVDDNSDIVVRKLLKNDQIPDSTKVLYRSSGWTVYMQEIFKLLHKYNIEKSAIKAAIEKIPAVDGIPVLIKKMYETLHFDIIIISDSNSIFIDDWLLAYNLKPFIKQVFTNPARYNDDNLLEIEMFHVQNECKLSTINLCKGKIMEDFIRKQTGAGVTYEQIVYVGDGKNDFCPILRLGKADLACARENYPLVDLLAKSNEKNSDNGKVIAKICIWKTGLDIFNCLDK